MIKTVTLIVRQITITFNNVCIDNKLILSVNLNLNTIFYFTCNTTNISTKPFSFSYDLSSIHFLMRLKIS